MFIELDALFGFKKRVRASVAAVTLRNRIGDPGLRADKKERARLGIPDGIWVRHHC